jgi:hypothetical protein
VNMPSTQERLVKEMSDPTPLPPLDMLCEFRLQGLGPYLAKAPHQKPLSLGVLLSLQGPYFVDHLYTLLLLRLPDEKGRKHYMQHLAAGMLRPEHCIALLRYSKEGRGVGRKVRGLIWFYAEFKLLKRWPPIGSCLAALCRYIGVVCVGCSRLSGFKIVVSR